MNRTVQHILVATTALLLHATTAGHAQTLSMDSCVALALQNNRSLSASRLQVEQTERSMRAYRANFFPNIKLSASDIFSTADGGFSTPGGYLPTFVPNVVDGSMTPNVLVNPSTGQPVMSADGTTPVFSSYAYHPDVNIDYEVGNVVQAGVVLEQPVYMGGKVSTAYRMARLGHEMAQQNERLTEQEIILRTQEAYSLLVHATMMRRVAVDYDSLLLRLQHDVEAAKRHGMASNNDLLKVRVKKSEAELQVQKAINGVRLAQMNLCHQMGWPLTTPVEPLAAAADDYLSAADAELSAEEGRGQWSALDGRLQNRPEYALLDYKTQLAIEKVKLERSEHLPQVTMLATYSYLHGVEVNDKTLLDNANFSAMLNVSIPLFHFGEGINKVKAARLEAERTRLEQEDMVEAMSLELAQAGNNLAEATLELATTRRNLDAATENLRASRKAYDVGLESLADLLEAQTIWQQACAKLVDARCSRALAESRALKAAGLLQH